VDGGGVWGWGVGVEGLQVVDVNVDMGWASRY
jgi:hypothetical protein